MRGSRVIVVRTQPRRITNKTTERLSVCVLMLRVGVLSNDDVYDVMPLP